MQIAGLREEWEVLSTGTEINIHAIIRDGHDAELQGSTLKAAESWTGRQEAN